jgi:hypothetical protein
MKRRDIKAKDAREMVERAGVNVNQLLQLFIKNEQPN